MGYRKLVHTGSVLIILFAGALFLNIKPANAVADLNITVTDSGQALGGATISLTFPDGSTQTVEDNDNDGQIGLVLRTPGRYQLTITTADGRSETTSFTAPSDGSVTVGYNAGTGRANVSVTDSSRSASSGKDSLWSWGLYGTIGFSDWEGQFDSGSGFTNGDTGNMRKYGFGGELRYDFPNFPLFLSNRFYYHARGRLKDRTMAYSGYDIMLRERWRNQMLLGWMVYSNDNFVFSLLAGITLARVRMEIFNGSSLWGEEKEIQFVPTFGAELQWAVNSAANMFYVLGATASIMNSITHNTGSNQYVRADNDLQWDIHTGFRILF